MRFVESWTKETWSIFTNDGTWVGLLRVDPDGKVRWKKFLDVQNAMVPKWADKTYESMEEAKKHIIDYMFVEWL